MIIAAILSNGLVSSGHASGAEVALIWLVIAAINIAYGRRR
jgi:hypothetical protein